MTKNRRSLIAFLLASFGGSALGQLYNGQAWKFFLYQAIVLTAVVPIIFRMSSPLLLMSVLLVSTLSLYIWSVVDAVLISRSLGASELKWYQRWYVYPIVYVLLFAQTTNIVSWIVENRVQSFKIPSTAMEPTLVPGDHLLVEKGRLMLHDEIKRDQIIVFRYPLDPKTYFVKRVVGVPGDRIHLEDKKVFRNGEALVEPYAIHKSSRIQQYRDNFPSTPSGTVFSEWADTFREYVQDGEIVVPPGRYFVMGDNRDFSSDSRYWGFVPRENIVSKSLRIYWSFDASGRRIRWNRMFRTVT